MKHYFIFLTRRFQFSNIQPHTFRQVLQQRLQTLINCKSFIKLAMFTQPQSMQAATIVNANYISFGFCAYTITYVKYATIVTLVEFHMCFCSFATTRRPCLLILCREFCDHSFYVLFLEEVVSYVSSVAHLEDVRSFFCIYGSIRLRPLIFWLITLMHWSSFVLWTGIKLAKGALTNLLSLSCCRTDQVSELYKPAHAPCSSVQECILYFDLC